MITGASTLDPGFPTWGTMLREHGYRTCWYGKWHLTHGDSHWTRPTARARSSATASRAAPTPRPNGAPGPGLARRPADRRPVRRLVRAGGRRRAVVHDRLVRQPARHRLVVRWSRPRPPRGAAPRGRGARCRRTSRRPSSSIARRKPRAAALAAGHRARSRSARCRSRGPGAAPTWLRVPRPLREAPARGRPPHRRASCARSRASPRWRRTRSIVFTSDHGEYGASHGLRGKGAGVYEEGIRVPLIVKDPRGVLTRRARTAAHTSSPRASTSRRCC